MWKRKLVKYKFRNCIGKEKTKVTRFTFELLTTLQFETADQRNWSKIVECVESNIHG